MTHPTLTDATLADATRTLRHFTQVCREARYDLEDVDARRARQTADAIDTVLHALDTQAVSLATQATTLAALTAQQRAQHETQAALWGALEELAHWPDLPGIPYYVLEPGMTAPSRREIPASQVVGIFQALRTQVATMLPWAVQATQDHYHTSGLQARYAETQAALTALTERHEALCAAVQTWADDEDIHGPTCRAMLALAGVTGFVPPDRAARETSAAETA